MRVFISVDIEGIGGVTLREQCGAGGQGYEAACRLMQAEALAAVEGAQAAGAEQVLVRDAHGSATNLSPEGWPPGVTLQSGWAEARGYDMVAGVAGGYEALLLVGYHAPAGDLTGILAHTMSGRAIRELRLNGQRASEATMVALQAGVAGVPTVFLAGDQRACESARAWIPEISTVVTKECHGFEAGAHRRPEDVRDEIRRAAESAVRERAQVPPLKIAPLAVELTFHNRRGALLAALDDQATLDPETAVLRASVADGAELRRRFEIWLRLAASATA